MALQISTKRYDGARPDLQGSGHVDVSGKGVSVMFFFGELAFRNSSEDAERQAREFAAAPEMLAALKAMVSMQTPEDAVAAIALADAAIAKAEGV